MTVLCDAAAMNSFFDDKKLRKEAEDAFQKLLDHCVYVASRSFDHTLWKRGEVSETASIPSGQELLSPTTQALDQSLPKLTDDVFIKRNGMSDEELVADDCLKDLAHSVIPHIRRIISEPDRVVSIFTNIVYYIIGPALRNRKQ